MKILPVLIMLAFLLGSYPVPVKCRSGSHFPTIDAPIGQSFGHLGHVGTDFIVPVGTEVYAAMDGIVIRAEDYGRVYGRYLMLLHCDGYLSLYAHLSAFSVNFGDIVHSGDLIALSGGDPDDEIDGDGWSSGAHLHFEVREPGHLDNNLYNIDPLEYLKFTTMLIIRGYIAQ